MIDAQKLFREITCIKTSEDIDSLRIAAKFTEFCFNELINRIENLININKYEKHDLTARKIESILDNSDKLN